MNKNHNVIKGILCILIIALLSIVGVSFVIKKQSAEIIKESGLSRAISNNLMDNIINIPTMGDVYMDKLNKAIMESVGIDIIINKITDQALQNAVEEGTKEYKYINLKEELTSICEESISFLKGISPKLQDEVKNKMIYMVPAIEKKINEYAKAYVKNEFEKDTPEIKAFDLYIFLTSVKFRFLCVAALIICIGIYIKLSLDFGKAFKGLGICCLFASFIFGILQLSGERIVMYISNHYLGRSVIIDLQYYVQTFIFMVGGMALIMTGRILDKNGKYNKV